MKATNKTMARMVEERKVEKNHISARQFMSGVVAKT